MTIDMQDDSITSVEQLTALIKAAETLGVDKVRRHGVTEEVYAWMSSILIRLRYRFLCKRDKGAVRRYLHLYSGYSASHIDHLIADYAGKGSIVCKARTQPAFLVKYTRNDIEMLASVAEGYNHQNGKALKEVCREMYEIYADERFRRLKDISVSHLYNLKKTPTYQTIATCTTYT